MEDHRRKWDKDEYEKLAKARLGLDDDEDGPSTREPPVKRELLKPREYKVSWLALYHLLENLISLTIFANAHRKRHSCLLHCHMNET